jgi:fluoroquinolone transport system ATP-binding protein
LKIRRGERRVRIEYDADGHTSQQEFPLDGLGDDDRFLALLREEKIETIHTEEATLEDIFIETTGKALV